MRLHSFIFAAFCLAISTSIALAQTPKDRGEVAAETPPAKSTMTAEEKAAARAKRKAEAEAMNRAATIPQSSRAIALGTTGAAEALRVRISGAGMEFVSMRITSKSKAPLMVNIPVGLLLYSANPRVQTMVTTQSHRIGLSTIGESRELTIRVACTEMAKDAPGKGDVLQISEGQPFAELAKLLSTPAFRNEPPHVQQFAIWTVTDNPERDWYRGNPGPSAFAAIRALLIAADLDPKKYNAFQYR